MNTKLNPDCQGAISRSASLCDLRSARPMCRSLRDDSQDAYWRASLREQFERVPSPGVGATPKESFRVAFDNSKAAVQRYLEPAAVQRKAQWDGVEDLALGWAAEHRLAVAQAFWTRATERLAGPRMTLREVMGELQRLVAILPAGAPSPLYTLALGALQAHDNRNARARLGGQEKVSLRALRTRLQCGQALSNA